MDAASQIQLAAVAGAAGSALVLLARERVALLAGFVMLAVAEVGLGLALVSADDLESAFTGPLRLAALVVTGGALVAIAALLVRFPALVPVALLAVAPVRISVTVGSEEAFLLVPLYAVLAAACAALLARVLTGREVVVLPLPLSVPATLVVALAGVSALWSLDVEASAVDLLFFYFPFALLVGIVARAPLARWLPVALGGSLTGIAIVLAAVGLWERATRQVVLARDLEVGNAYESFFRTASLLRDPSIYGRYLAVAILVILVGLWLTRLNLVAGAATIAFLGLALFFTYSQSSMIALIVGVLFVAAAAGRGRSRTIVLVGALAPLLLASAVLAAVGQDESLRQLTSGRSDLVANSTDIVREHPIGGVGIGAEEKVSGEIALGQPNRIARASHTAPLTVAAELGIVGVAAFLVFLAASVRLFYFAWLRDRVLGVGLSVVFLAIFVHALFYSGFLEDPLVWLSLGLAAALVSRPLPD
jgi:O-antigen ligase/polysaccharide polymerase Wzy-like membrane protein